MPTRLYITALLLTTTWLLGQNFKVLHYTETSGFDHQTRANSLAMLQDLGSKNGWSVNDDQTGNAFNSLGNLKQYAVVVFSNTSGDQILDSAQRANFEAYINGGGSLVGIHAASDTYRHSTANGSNTGTWDWYAEVLGGSVQQSPNHTAAGYNGTLDLVGTHPTIAYLPNPWEKVEEYYYWENGFLQPGHNIVLMVRFTGNQSYDAPRPMSWYKRLVGGGRLFYTALGHANSNFTSDTAFQNHIRDAILWAAGSGMNLPELQAEYPVKLFPNPARDFLKLKVVEEWSLSDYKIIDAKGTVCKEGKLVAETTVNLRGIPNGRFVLQLFHGSEQISLPFIKVK